MFWKIKLLISALFFFIGIWLILIAERIGVLSLMASFLVAESLLLPRTKELPQRDLLFPAERSLPKCRNKLSFFEKVVMSFMLIVLLTGLGIGILYHYIQYGVFFGIDVEFLTSNPIFGFWT